jgi:diguanylate cyclase (GGDEF)-like protein/PAS domain S-box-containing protein
MDQAELATLAAGTLDSLGQGIWAVLPKGRWKVIWNDAMFDIYGLPRGSEPPNNETVFKLTHPDDANYVARQWVHVLETGGPHRWRDRVLRPTGEIRHVIVKAMRLPLNERGESWLLGTMNDITDLVDTNAILESERAFRFVAENIRDVVLRTSSDGRIEFVSRSVRHLLGREPESLVGTYCRDFIHPDDAERFQAALREQIAERRQAREETMEYRVMRGDGQPVWIESSPRLVFDANDNFIGWVDVARDITQRRAADARIAHMARHDALTDLPNRVEFDDRLAQALSTTGGRRRIAVLCLDLDRFKAVNDTLGHAAGDELLVQVTRRLLANVPADRSLVARIGGDEFVLFVAGAGAEEASVLAASLIDSVGEAYEIDGQTVNIGLSVGIALAPRDGKDPQGLVRTADMALYRAKAEGRGTFRFFDAEMGLRMQERRQLEMDMRRALAEGRFQLHFQPLVEVDSGRIVAAEALVRWRLASGQMIAPSEFIPLAEEIGLIVPLGQWILQQACRIAATWPEHVRVAVNLSPVQFRHPGLVGMVTSALANAGLSPARLELEITESVLMQDDPATMEMLHRLKTLGIAIALDDFGTGYSSLSYLRSFPFDKIKIDRSFVADMESRADAAAIVRAVASLGSSLGMTTTAEGIETQAQLDRLRAEGCKEVQGYLLSRPIDALKLRALLSRELRGKLAA